MHEIAHVAARAARSAATILGAVPLLIFATGLAVAGPPGQDMENATEPTPAAFPPQSCDSVAVQSFLDDDAALMAWLEAHNKDVLAAAARVGQAAARQNLDLQRSRLENGDLSGNDFDRLLVDTLLLESEVDANRQESESTAAACGAVLADPCSVAGAGIESVNRAAALPPAPDARAAIERRPDIQALALARDAANRDALLAHRRRIPDPSLSLGYTHDNLTISGDQPRTFLFSIAIPLPVFDRGQHEASRAEARARELEWMAAGARQRGRADVDALLKRRASLERTLGELLGQAVPKSKGVLEATLGAVNRGGMSMTDLLLARRTHTDLLLKVMDLQFDLFIVRNDLRRALGLDADLARAAAATPEVRP